MCHYERWFHLTCESLFQLEGMCNNSNCVTFHISNWTRGTHISKIKHFQSKNSRQKFDIIKHTHYYTHYYTYKRYWRDNSWLPGVILMQHAYKLGSFFQVDGSLPTSGFSRIDDQILDIITLILTWIWSGMKHSTLRLTKQ